MAWLLTIIPANRNFIETENGIDIFLISNGVHTDLCLPAKTNVFDWTTVFNASEFQPQTSYDYISFGWGDKGFFLETPTWNDLTVKTAIKASLMSSSAAMHVTYYTGKPQAGELTRKIQITKEQLVKLVHHVIRGLALNNGQVQLIDCCRYPGYNDNFYEARGTYHLLNTCNVWTNDALKVAGIKTASWAPFDWCVIYHFQEKSE